MPRRRKVQLSTNHERWLISYSDFVTLLFAFFVVMYSISQVNESKYRVLSDTLQDSFNLVPHAIKPVQVGGASFSRAPGVIENTDYQIVLIIPERDFIPSFLEISGLSILACLIATIIAVIISLLNIKSALKPMSKLDIAFNEISSGSGDLTTILPISNDETGSVSRGFNDFTSHLNDMVKLIKEEISSGDIHINKLIDSTKTTFNDTKEITKLRKAGITR